MSNQGLPESAGNSGSALSPAEEELLRRLRMTPLLTRLQRCMEMVGRMCSERRPPRMCVPVQWDDEDQYIIETLKDAFNKIVEGMPDR